jgi:hypothetical protein
VLQHYLMNAGSHAQDDVEHGCDGSLQRVQVAAKYREERLQ